MISVNKIYCNKFQKINKKGSGSLNFTKNYPKIGEDKINLRPYHTIYGEMLKHVYGINSNIKDEKILKCIIPAIKDFCKVNNDNNMFNGLTLEETSINNKNCMYINNTNFRTNYSIIFNNQFDWENIDKYTQEQYDNGISGSENPKYYMYKTLAGFLNYKYNPFAYNMNTNTIPQEDVLDFIKRISDSDNLADFNSAYIATKMCQEFVPKILDDIFEDNIGNTDLKFPPQKPYITYSGSAFDFKDIDDAKNYLKENFGIKANFDNLRCANECCAAVFDLTCATGSKNIFCGLEIDTKPEFFSVTSESANMCIADTIKIYINPANNWKQCDKIEKKQFDMGIHPTYSVKNNVFVHELAHYLDYKGNSKRCLSLVDDNENYEKVRNIYLKVSKYSSEDSAEFCAEYVAGKMAGIKYPKIVDEEFKKTWNGPKFIFP